VHPMSLLGKEVRERLEQRPDLCREVRLLASDEQRSERSPRAPAAPRSCTARRGGLEGVDLAIFCGDIAADRLALAQLPPTIRAVVASYGPGSRTVCRRSPGSPAILG